MTKEEKERLEVELKELIKNRREFRYAIGTDHSYSEKTREGMLQAEANLTKQIEEIQKKLEGE